MMKKFYTSFHGGYDYYQFEDEPSIMEIHFQLE